jgi:aquaporin Z
MSSPEGTDARMAATSQPMGKAALIASVGGQRGFADWANPDHRLRRLLAEFIGVAGLYWVVQFAAAACGSLLARAFFGVAGNLVATMPPPGLAWQAAGFEAILTFGLVLMVLNLANGPKLNGPFVPLAVGAYIMAWGTMGGPFDGASMNPARSFGPDLAIGNLSTWWVYLLGPVVGALIAVGVAYVLRGPAKAQEARAAEGTPLDQGT